MKTILLSACAAALIAIAAAPAFAGQPIMSDNGPSGAIIGATDNGGGYNGNDWRYQSNGYGDDDNTWGQGYGNQGYGNQGYGNGGYGNQGWGNSGWGNGGYGNYGVLPPHAIVRYLHRSNFSQISRPLLAGRFYQVKAIDPRGRKVKLYVDAYNGRIVKLKRR